MSNYVKSTNFAVKDTLITGDPDKKIKGTEIDAEYNNIATAVNSKANTASPTLTGTPAAPTASAGTNTTQVATTAFVTTAVTNLSSTLGTMSTQAASAVAVTGGTITGVTIDGTTTTQTSSDNSTKLASTAYVKANIASLGTNGNGNRTVSTSSPSGGANGDIWYKY